MEVKQSDSNISDNALREKLELLENEKYQMQTEFNLQRAKMKELFLQKENDLLRKNEQNNELKTEISKLRSELDDIKSQLVVTGLAFENDVEQEKRKAHEEIASLQQLVHETVEESSSTRRLYDLELKKLQNFIQQLQDEIADLKKINTSQQSSQDQNSLVPSVVLNAFTKGLVKKIGADSFLCQDNAEDNIRKVDNGHVNEDAEVLRSLIGPLEDQIQALKEKLRATDDQLQKCKECGHFNQLECTEPLLEKSTTSTIVVKSGAECDMCSNYEAQLVNEQKRTIELKMKVQMAEKSAERHREDLLKEIGFRKEMEEKWNEKKEQLKQKVSVLTESTDCAEQDLRELRQLFEQNVHEMHLKLNNLTMEREELQNELTKLQNENSILVGKYAMHSQELESEAINLPDKVDELQEIILKYHQDLIITKVGKEAAEETINSLQSNIISLKSCIENVQHEKESLKIKLLYEIEELEKHKHHLEEEKKLYLANQEKLENLERTNQIKMNDLRQEISSLNMIKKTLEEKINELRKRVSSLQQELDTSETVQKDFVRLSQSLQMQLEKIRESDTQVRWQHEEDVTQCPTCRCSFNDGNYTNKPKVHCRHCGQIFCTNCLTRTVESGASMLPSKVCDVCHTLLVKSSAPYFSEVPPPMT